MFDLGLLAKKLIACRVRLQYTYVEIFEGTGIIQSRLIEFEQGHIEPTGDEILILADFYKEDYKYFISNQQLSAAENTDSLYRQFTNEFSKEDRRAIQEFLYLCECEQETWNLTEDNNKSYSPPTRFFRFHTEGEEVAKDVRLYLGYKEEELIRNIFDDFRKLRIHIFRRKLSNSNISGVFIMHPIAGKCVLINFSEDLYRQNFTIAHEVAHSIFDTDQAFNVSFTKDGKDVKEIRANSFAANFLMPANLLRGLKVSNWSIEIITKIAEQFKVNIIALLYRLKSLKLIDEDQLEKLKKHRLPQATKTDPELQGLSEKLLSSKKAILEIGLSTAYVRRCHETYLKGFISQSRLAEMLLVNEPELPKLLALFNLKLIYDF